MIYFFINFECDDLLWPLDLLLEYVRELVGLREADQDEAGRFLLRQHCFFYQVYCELLEERRRYVETIYLGLLNLAVVIAS